MKAPLLPSSIIFLIMTLFSGLLTITSTSWIFTFAGLVINTAAVIPNLIQLSIFGWKTGESAGKYFLVQAKASTSYALGSAIYWHWDIVDYYIFNSSHLHWGLVIIMTSLVMKLGLFPFYAWVPGVMLGVSWFNCWLILTWQKYFPLVLFTQILSSSQGPSLHAGFMVSLVLTALSGAILGMGQTNLRSLVAYSSIVHGGWSLMSSFLGILSSTFYISVYAWTLGITLFLLSKSSARSIQDPLIIMGGSSSSNYTWLMIISILSLAGMPPLLGFLGKWMVISQWGALSLPVLPLVSVLASSFISLNYYLSICWGAFWRAASEPWSLKTDQSSLSLGVLLTVNIMFYIPGILVMGTLY